MTETLASHATWAVIGVAITGTALVVVDHRRALAVALGVQYIFASWLTAESLGLGVGAAQALGGILATLMIWLTWESAHGGARVETDKRDLMSLRSFRWVVGMLVLFAAWGLGRRAWMGLPGLTETGTLGATFLMLLGLSQASLYRVPMRVVLGLLTVLSGFGIAYGAVESSLAVIALLIIVHLGLALAGSYLTIVQATGAEGGTGG